MSWTTGATAIARGSPSTVALYLLPVPVIAVAGDDAADATWWPFGSLDQLGAAITTAGRTLYNAHRPLLQRALDHLDQAEATAPATSIAELIAQHATHLAHLTDEPLAETGSDLIDQLREGEERLRRAGIQGGGALGVAAGLLDQALDVELDGGTQLDQEATVGSRREPAVRPRGRDRRIPPHGCLTPDPEQRPRLAAGAARRTGRTR
ncbi:hypothetical protein ACH4A7_36990 [Streptomyces cyaneofuscatus]|uniref:hypothetical protein n=1 Tax=Streptomyces cyaneofuscatus TaxID=66883 RepID=UPI0037AA8FEA